MKQTRYVELNALSVTKVFYASSTSTNYQSHLKQLQLHLMKKRSEETHTLRAGCSKVEPKIWPHRRPLPGGAGRPKFNQLETVTTFTYKPSLVRIDAHNFELSW